MAFTSGTVAPISGINGVVKDGFVTGRYCYDAGQPCCGDMLDWFVNNQVPGRYYAQAKNANVDIHFYLSQLAEKNQPWQNTLTVLDWWNGNRGILNDMSLTGCVLGYTLNTRPENIYCAMLQGIACGSRKIIQHLNENGIDFKRIIVCGGIPDKNRFAIQQYANILNRELLIPKQGQITARGTAVLAAIAAGNDVDTTVHNMTVHDFIHILPDREHSAEYEYIFKRWEQFHDIIGYAKQNGAIVK
jgi:L-ribulokinase